jgi:NAD-dependent dihydropyrimidine dehydrogenase PreA subunit
MATTKRQMIQVDEEKCDGCGQCIPGCPEGALQIVAGKARLVRESYCDGLGACLGECPNGALRVVELESAQYDETSVIAHLRQTAPDALEASASDADAAGERLPSELRQWPVQLRLLPVRAPFFQGADLTLVADCVPFANPNFHADVLKGTAVAVGCPKLDDAQSYVEKVTQILSTNDIRSLKVVYMEVPCCRGLVWIAEQALARSGKQIPYESEMVRIGL